jgi:hypothetical protein
MTGMVLEVMELEVAGSEPVTEYLRVPKHPQVAFAHLTNATIHPSLKHRTRAGKRLHRLHCLVTEYPGLPVQGDVIDVLQSDAGLGEAVVHCLERKTDMVLLSGEPLFLDGRHDLAVADQSGRRVAERGQSEDVSHALHGSRPAGEACRCVA